MKRSLALVAAVAVVATPVVAQAAPKAPKKTTRTVSVDYSGFSSAAVNGAGSFYSDASCGTTQCADFDTVKGEKLVKVEATDASGRPVGLQVWVDGGYNPGVTYHCGSTTVKVSPKSGHVVSVRPTLLESCAGVPTEGTIKATITNF
jgi:hypothetical protein